MKNIILIGMPASGKSTIGVILAKTAGFSFLDSDLLIQERKKKKLQEIIDGESMESFLRCEEEALLRILRKRNTVIATGGSAVLSESGMAYLKENGVCVWLKADLRELEKRLGNIKTRGIAAEKGQSISDIYSIREPYYKKWADFVIPTKNMSAEDTVNAIIKELRGNKSGIDLKII